MEEALHIPGEKGLEFVRIREYCAISLHNTHGGNYIEICILGNSSFCCNDMG